MFNNDKFKEISEESYPINKNELLIIKIKKTTIVLVRQFFYACLSYFLLGSDEIYKNEKNYKYYRK